jgi:hypothetical protein
VQDLEQRTPLDVCKLQIQSGATSAGLNGCFGDSFSSMPFACEWRAVKRLLQTKDGDRGGKAKEAAEAQSVSHVHPAEVCASCGGGGGGGALKKCGQCRSVRYCGGDCQRKHWPVHKAHCKGKSKSHA